MSHAIAPPPSRTERRAHYPSPQAAVPPATNGDERGGCVHELPFIDDGFDLVIDFGTCYHVAGGDVGARPSLAEVARVLSLGGGSRAERCAR